jgi:hypothetical protein
MLNLACKPVPEDKPRMFRDKAHKITDDWVDSLAPALCGDKPLTMEEISALFEEYLVQLVQGRTKSTHRYLRVIIPVMGIFKGYGPIFGGEIDSIASVEFV